MLQQTNNVPLCLFTAKIFPCLPRLHLSSSFKWLSKCVYLEFFTFLPSIPCLGSDWALGCWNQGLMQVWRAELSRGDDPVEGRRAQKSVPLVKMQVINVPCKQIPAPCVPALLANPS